jgi:hypothetical protein
METRDFWKKAHFYEHTQVTNKKRYKKTRTVAGIFILPPMIAGMAILLWS